MFRYSTLVLVTLFSAVLYGKAEDKNPCTATSIVPEKKYWTSPLDDKQTFLKELNGLDHHLKNKNQAAIIQLGKELCKWSNAHKNCLTYLPGYRDARLKIEALFEVHVQRRDAEQTRL